MKKLVFGMLAVGFLSACQQVDGWFGKNETKDSTQTRQSESSNTASFTRDVTITRENAYADLFLDSAVLENYIKTKNVSGSNADRMRNFYLLRNNQFAWFTSAGITEQGRGIWSLYASSEKKSKNDPAASVEKRMDSLVANDSAVVAANDTALAQTELALTAQFVQLASENNGAVTAANFYYLVPTKKVDVMSMADSLLNRQKDSTLWQNNTTYKALKTHLSLYYAAAQKGAWPTLSAGNLHKGSKTPAVTVLKKRLAATGDYSPTDTSTLFSDSLVMAIKTVQEQYGFTPTGRLTDSLIAELNVPAQQRVQQIILNMNRSLWLPTNTDSNEVVINIPSLELIVYSDTGKVMQMPVVVGKEGTGTIAFRDKISEVVFSPYWNIPQSIVQNEIKPAMQADPDYLKKKNMEIVKQDDSLPQIRQLPGKDNALGRAKFLFPNSFAIYLHDTPNKDVFAQKNRALSHGCIRVAQPDSLARYVLRDQAAWTPEKIAAAMNSGKEQRVTVKKPVPVVISYYTAFIDPTGKLNFRKDVYGYDQKTGAKMFAPAATAANSPA